MARAPTHSLPPKIYFALHSHYTQSFYTLILHHTIILHIHFALHNHFILHSYFAQHSRSSQSCAFMQVNSPTEAVVKASAELSRQLAQASAAANAANAAMPRQAAQDVAHASAAANAANAAILRRAAQDVAHAGAAANAASPSPAAVAVQHLGASSFTMQKRPSSLVDEAGDEHVAKRHRESTLN
jgi:hypothetical protein